MALELLYVFDFFFFRSLRKQERNIIHVNLAVSMLLAQTMFLLGADKIENKVYLTINKY